jgi:anti-repressor protein
MGSILTLQGTAAVGPTPFDFEGKRVTVIADDSGSPWFVAMEVAGILGYSDAEAMTRRLDEDEKQNLRIVGFGPRGVTAISEAGLYASIVASQKAEAKPFKRWVTHEVLPAIRKTGSYSLPAPAELSRMQILEMAMESERERLVLAEQLAAAAPAVEFVDRYVESTGLMTFRQVAKLLQAKEPEFREFLREAKIMYVLNGEWTAHAQHIEAGRFKVRAGTAKNDHAFNACKFTPKGVRWVTGELAKWQVEQRQKEGAHA